MECLPNRKHPFRLHDEVYQTQNQPLFVTIQYRLRDDLDGRLAQTLLAVLTETAERWRVGLHAYCLMPTHMHFVCSAGLDGDFLTFVNRLKREGSRRLHRAGFTGFAWQRSMWDRYLREDEEVRTRIYYLLDNPVRKGLCEHWGDWPWSAYCGWPDPGGGELEP
jgi:REP element-mobilizing transposase RayT